jgi:hypothetical protein
MWFYCGDLTTPHTFLVIGCYPITSDCDSCIKSFPVSNLELRCKGYKRSKQTSSCYLSNYTCFCHITQHRAATPWGWKFCKHDAPIMLGFFYKMNDNQHGHCSFYAFEVASGYKRDKTTRRCTLIECFDVVLIVGWLCSNCHQLIHSTKPQSHPNL